MAKRRIAVLGSTGSIGTQTLDVVRQHGDKLEIVGLAVNSSLDVLLAQAREFGVRHLAVGNAALANDRWPFPRARRTRRRASAWAPKPSWLSPNCPRWMSS